MRAVIDSFMFVVPPVIVVLLSVTAALIVFGIIPESPACEVGLVKIRDLSGGHVCVQGHRLENAR